MNQKELRAQLLLRELNLDDQDVIELLKSFEERATNGAWLYIFGEDGSYEIFSREETAAEYISRTLQSVDAEEIITDFRGAKTFYEAREEVYSFLLRWSKEILGCAREVKTIKKPKPISGRRLRS